MDQHRDTHVLPQSFEFIRIHGNVVVTSIRQTNPGIEVRFFNPNTEIVNATIELLKDYPQFTTIKIAELVDFEHQPVSERLRFEEGTLSLEIEPKQILTLRLVNKSDN